MVCDINYIRYFIEYPNAISCQDARRTADGGFHGNRSKQPGATAGARLLRR